MRIDEILIGERVRKDMGDLQGLAESIKTHGLLHPVVVKTDGTLVAGHRRLEAVRLIGWSDVAVTVIDVADLLSAERDENEERKDWTPSEAVAIGRLIEEQERPAALARIKAGRPYGDSTQGRASVADVAAEAVGMARQKYTQAKDVLQAAESDPEKFGDLPSVMDESGNVRGTHREMERRKRGEPPDPAFNGKRNRQGTRKDKTAPYDPSSPRQVQLAEGQKSRLVSSLSTVTGHCRGLEDLDVLMALSVCSKEEIKTWAAKARDASRAFRKLAGKLEEGLK